MNYGISDFDVRTRSTSTTSGICRSARAGASATNASGLRQSDHRRLVVLGLTRWTSGFPFSVQNCRSCWPTNWNLQGNASADRPEPLPETATIRNAVDNRPSAWADAEEALTKFRFSLPGEAGGRNNFRGDGYFNIDISVTKAFRLFSDNRLRFRWDTFNVTNTPKFDVARLTMLPDRTGFGRYNGTLATCDAQAGRCMQFALRYEF